MRYRLLSGVLVIAATTQAFAQKSRSAERWLDDCRRGRYSGDHDREQYYAQADLTIDTADLGPDQVVGRILAALRARELSRV